MGTVFAVVAIACGGPTPEPSMPTITTRPTAEVDRDTRCAYGGLRAVQKGQCIVHGVRFGYGETPPGDVEPPAVVRARLTLDQNKEQVIKKCSSVMVILNGKIATLDANAKRNKGWAAAITGGVGTTGGLVTTGFASSIETDDTGEPRGKSATMASGITTAVLTLVGGVVTVVLVGSDSEQENLRNERNRLTSRLDHFEQTCADPSDPQVASCVTASAHLEGMCDQLEQNLRP